MGDQERVSLYNINTISSRQVMRIKKNNNQLIQYQIIQTDITRTIWQTVSRIANKNLGVKGLKKILLNELDHRPKGKDHCPGSELNRPGHYDHGRKTSE